MGIGIHDRNCYLKFCFRIFHRFPKTYHSWRLNTRYKCLRSRELQSLYLPPQDGINACRTGVGQQTCVHWCSRTSQSIFNCLNIVQKISRRHHTSGTTIINHFETQVMSSWQLVRPSARLCLQRCEGFIIKRRHFRLYLVTSVISAPLYVKSPNDDIVHINLM